MLIPILNHENELQLNDLTRFEAINSIAVKGSNPINSVKIKPGANATELEVFNASAKNWFLDYAFNDWAFDVDSESNELHFETNGVQYSTNVASATYATLANLLTAVKNAMEAVASPLTVSFTVDERNVITISPSQSLTIQPNKTSKTLFKHLGFKKDGQLVSYPVEYGLRKITLTVASISESASISRYMQVYTKDGDALFSNDGDLVSEEPDLMKWLPQGRGSFLDLHRKSQKLIVDFMDRNGFRDDDGDKLTKWTFIDNSDVRVWSYYQVLKLFFMGAQNAKDDVFKKKADYYEKQEIAARNRVLLTLDKNKDGKADLPQGSTISSGKVFFR